MTHNILIGVAVILGLFGLGIFIDLFRHKEDFIEQYEKDFPGKCGICAFHAFGLRERLTEEPLPLDHRCPEKWGRWVGRGRKPSV